MRLLPRLVALAAVALLAAACMTSADAITGRPWRLLSIDGRPPAADARLEFDAGGQVTFQPGCNTGGGPYTIDFNRIRTGELAITAMRCADDAVDTQEATFLAVLDGDPTFGVNSGSGELRLEGNGTTLLFDAP